MKKKKKEKNFLKKSKKPKSMTSVVFRRDHLRFTSGIICGRDHLRSNLGIISGLGIICDRGSFAALYSSHKTQKLNSSVFSHHVTAAMLGESGQNRETAAMLEEWNSLLGIEIYFSCKLVILFQDVNLAAGRMSENPSIVQERTNRIEVEMTNLHFLFFLQRKMQTCPPNLDSVVLFVNNSKIACCYRIVTMCFIVVIVVIV